MPNDDSTKPEPRRASRPTLIFDADFWLSPDFQCFKQKAGADGFTYLIALLGVARRSTDYKLKVTDNRIIGYSALLGIEVERVKEIIKIGVETTLLEQDGDFVWSPYQMRNIQSYVQKCETLRQNARQKANAKHLQSICSADAKQMPSKSLEETETETEIEIDLTPTPKVDPTKVDHTKHPKKPELPDPRQAYGPDGWFLSTAEQYAVMVKDKGQQWVDYWVEAFADWAQSKKPQVSRSRKNHWLSIKRWEQMRLEKGLQWYNAHSSGPGYYYAEEIQKDAARMFGGPNSFGGLDAN
jgi:hypothetical protein